MRNLAKRFWRQESGATAIEYGLICALLVTAMAAVFPLVAGETTSMFNKVGAAMQTATK
ncbi:MAG: Flp family type IVb pilin [Alphaproteobacteria bacterium]